MSEGQGKSLAENALPAKDVVLQVEDERLEGMFRLVLPHLSDYDPKNPREMKVASLGGGLAMPVEVGPLAKIFPLLQYTGIENDDDVLEYADIRYNDLQKRKLRTANPNIVFKKADATRSETFESLKDLDLIIVRNPDIHNGQWHKIFQNGYNTLKKDGLFLITTNEESAYVKAKEAFLPQLGVQVLVDGINPYRADKMTVYNSFYDLFNIIGKK